MASQEMNGCLVMKLLKEEMRQRIVEAARDEFFQSGYARASMRAIAERAGYSTGMLYGRFADKSELFRELVEPAAQELLDYFSAVEDAFAAYPPERQHREMHSYVGDKVDEMIDRIYADIDCFRLILTKSAGSGYEYYLDKMIDIETRNTIRFIDALNAAGIRVNEVRADLSHMLSSAMINGIFEAVAHDFPKEEARGYIKQVEAFFNAGWDKLLGL